jgi:hypothetical protein
MLQCLSDQYALAAPGANTAFPGTALQPNNKGRLEVAIALTNAAVVSLVTVRSGTTYTLALNDGVAIPADTLYSFSFPCSKDSTYAFKISVDGIVKILQVNEYWD